MSKIHPVLEEEGDRALRKWQLMQPKFRINNEELVEGSSLYERPYLLSLILSGRQIGPLKHLTAFDWGLFFVCFF